MIEFLGTNYNTHEDEVIALVDAMRRNAEKDSTIQTFTNLNGVRLVADPAVYARRPDYTLELQWTYGMAFRQPAVIADLLRGRGGCPNLVPELEGLVVELLAELDELDSADHAAVLRWFVRLAPATWHRDVLNKRQKQRIVEHFERYRGYQGWQFLHSEVLPAAVQLRGQYYVRAAMSAVTYFSLHTDWLFAARSWLAENQ